MSKLQVGCARRTAFLTGCLAALLGYPASAGAGLDYPPAARGPVTDDYHGTRVADPYRWLEDLDSRETRAWVSAEAKLTQAYLGEIAERATLRKRIAALYEYPRYGVPFHEAGRYFYTLNAGHQEQSLMYMAPALTALSLIHI